MLSKAIILLIKIYQYCVSPMLGPHCRFTPTCSQYALDAIRQYGPYKGVVLAGRRILKCHPFHAGGVDPVPSKHHHHS